MGASPRARWRAEERGHGCRWERCALRRLTASQCPEEGAEQDQITLSAPAVRQQLSATLVVVLALESYSQLPCKS